MKFKLNNYNREISEEDLIADLQSVAKRLQKEYISKNEYLKNGKYSVAPFIRSFGGWINALETSGLATERSKQDLKIISNEQIITDIRRIAESLNKDSISSTEYTDNGQYRVQTILARFSNWENALTTANLKPTGIKIKISDNELLTEIERIWVCLGRQPTTTDIKNGISLYSLNSFCRRFGGWRKALEYFIDYINKTEKSDFVEEVILENKNEDNSEINEKKSRKKNVSRRTPRDINLRLRFKVFQRDSFKCCICGKSPATDTKIILHVDHIKPWSKGGETVIENLQVLCSKCNLGKSDLE